jgi:hypothetical protein
MNIYEKLLLIQQELKAPKGQYNSFGKYKYRSCEDILEAVKPICAKYNALLTVSDELVYMGDRYYIKATATLTNTEDTGVKIYKHEYDEITNQPILETVKNTAYAREEETKKGMDGSQITGTASSYARKYALNGLFCIDDTKDADTDEFKKQEDKPEPKIDRNMIDTIQSLATKYAEIKNGNADELLKYYLNKFKALSIENLTYSQGIIISKELSNLIERGKQQ